MEFNTNQGKKNMKFSILNVWLHLQTATKLDETSVVALSGIIACQIHDGQYDVSNIRPNFYSIA